jgi:hypothetical protein
MNSISVDMGQVDIYFDQLAEGIVSNGAEGEILHALALELKSTAHRSRDEAEKAFCLKAAEQCANLQLWFRDNAP